MGTKETRKKIQRSIVHFAESCPDSLALKELEALEKTLAGVKKSAAKRSGVVVSLSGSVAELFRVGGSQHDPGEVGPIQQSHREYRDTVDMLTGDDE